jgi:hypothetical protein
MKPDFETYIRERFAGARVNVDPYPHLVIEDVLPPKLYAQIEGDIPSTFRWYCSALYQTFMVQLGTARRQHPSRKWSLVPGCLFRAASAAFPRLRSPIGQRIAQPAIDCANPDKATAGLHGLSRAWHQRYGDAISFVNSLVEKAFAPHTERYLAELIEAGVFESHQEQRGVVQEFCHRIRGWTISPHAHDIGQSIQWMIYFPAPGSTEDQGTMFYRLKGNKVIPGEKMVAGTVLFDPDEVDYCFTAPYRNNILVAFLNAPYCVHATSEDSGSVPRRYFFGCNWWAARPKSIDLAVTPRSISPAVDTE